MGLSWVAAIFLFGARYIFYNIWTLLLTLLFIVSPVIADNLDLDIDSIRKKNKSAITSTESSKTTWYYCTSNEVLNVRKRPFKDAEVIGVLQPKQAVEGYSTGNGFAKIKFEGGIGYASLKYLSTTKPTK